MATLEELFRALVDSGGSDLHLKAGSVPHLRTGEELHEAPFDVLTPAELEAFALEVLPAGADALEHRNEVEVAYSVSGVGRFRVGVYHQRGSLAMTVRLVPVSTPAIDALGLPPVVGRLADERRGLVLVAGPAASGRSTTAAAVIDHINRTRGVHIVTVEDPIEVLHADQRAVVSQREVGSDVAGFAAAIRGARRLDPDVLFVSDLVNGDAAQAALEVAEAGCLVIASLGVVGVAAALERFVSLFPAAERSRVRCRLAGVLRGAVAQQLVARADERGRVAVVEVLVATAKVAAAIGGEADDAALHELLREGEYHGMQTHDQALLALCRAGVVSRWDAMASAEDAEGLRIELEKGPAAPPTGPGGQSPMGGAPVPPLLTSA